MRLLQCVALGLFLSPGTRNYRDSQKMGVGRWEQEVALIRGDAWVQRAPWQDGFGADRSGLSYFCIPPSKKGGRSSGACSSLCCTKRWRWRWGSKNEEPTLVCEGAARSRREERR